MKITATEVFHFLGVVEHQLPRSIAGGFDCEYPLSATAPENDDQNRQTSITTAMSDVDAFSSLPAALHAGPNATAVTVNPLSTPGQLSSKRVSPSSHCKGNDGYIKEVDSAVGDGDGPPSPKADSEAETIIQSGRESLSPEKGRKYIQHEPKRRDDGDDNVHQVEGSLLHARKRKRWSDDSPAECDRDMSPAPHPRRTDSPSRVKIEKSEELQSLSKLEPSRPSHNTDTVASHENQIARKRSHSESVDGDKDRARSGRHTTAPRDKERNDINGIVLPRPQSNDRSVSPIRSVHKRTASVPQLGGSDLQKKRKAPSPLIPGSQRQSSEDRQSASSSTSGSPLPSAHLRRLACVDGASASPARPTGHKKQRDQNGRTRLARACAAQELEVAIARHAERPEDLNVADNAGNTPLQIAALEGCAPIVKFLLDAGCDIDTKNIDKDTPLIDAVENGHLEVVKLLLEAGANPRTVNAEGDEPYDLVPSDSEDYAEIRRVLAEAKANPRPNRRSEERAGSGNKETSSRRIPAASPRESPVHGPRSPPLFGIATKRKSVRSEATRNDLLWTKATPENLQAFAAKGDIAGVANILNVGQKADTESMIAAAKGGHDEVLSLLLGMGDADPDPEPFQGGNQKPGYNTPMLAAIGRGNLAVIRLLLDQPKFDPTRQLYRGRTYFELSQDRKADNWEEEYDILRDAFDNYHRAGRSHKQDPSSLKRSRDRDKENKRPGRRDSPSPVAPSRKAIGSQNTGHHREFASKDASSAKEKKRDGLSQLREKPGSNTMRPKISHKNGDNSTAGSDPDGSRLVQPKSSITLAKEEETPRRRRLIPGRPPQDRDRRRPSIPSSDSLSGREEAVKARVDRHTEVSTVKHGPRHLKRGHSSPSPERPPSRGRDSDHNSREIQKKKRRVLSEDGTSNIANGRAKKAHDPNTRDDSKSPARLKKDEDRLSDRERDRHPGASLPQKVNGSRVVKQERERQEASHLADIPMEDARSATKKSESEADEHRRARRAEKDRLAEEERIAAEARKAKIGKEEEEHAARLAKEKAEEEERKRKEAEQRRIKQAEDELQKRLEQERLRLAKLHREQEVQEQRRRDALPSRLRIAAHLVGSNDPQAKSHTWLKKFMPVVTALTKQLDPSCDISVADEKWVPNYLVAPLLATNDLQLSQYSSWEKRDATPTQRENLWRVTRRMLVQADETELMSSSFGQVMQKDCETRPKYFDMEHVFWVKLSDFMDLVPHVPHLHGLDIQFLRMHIDQEPFVATPLFELARPNGYGSEPTPLDDVNGLPTSMPNLTNGYGHSRPSTYV